eukprot:10073087-Karenia_brevis.AAC.1
MKGPKENLQKFLLKEMSGGLLMETKSCIGSHTSLIAMTWNTGDSIYILSIEKGGEQQDED